MSHDLSVLLASIVEKTQPSIVRIATKRRATSGIVWSEDGLVVTASHNLRRSGDVEVEFADGRSAPASLIGRDPTTDVAALKIEDVSLSPLALAEDAEPKVGHLVLVLGRPGKSIRATLGMLSVVGESWRTPLGGDVDRYLEVDASLPRGFSGGALVDLDGRLLGMNTSRLTRSGATLPTPTLRRVVDKLVQKGGIKRGHLGVAVQPADLPPEAAEAAGQTEGLLVTSVEKDSPAAGGGISLGDVILSIGGEPVDSFGAMISALGDKGGEEVTIRLWRTGASLEVTVTLGERDHRGCC